MAKFTVTSQQLEAAKQNLTTLNNQFKQFVTDMESDEGTLNGQWDGDANDAFHQAFTTDKGKMIEFYNLINQYVAALDQIKSRYDTAEAANLEIAKNRTY